ncbi:MAG: response regulator [Rhodospirillaceae bacterium]|jgi:two-component system, chemotaxis family, chemotaxis protein CheY|nr:response regulator [Rhodospirillaceae bacterium]MBT4487157.1 response regulator [Rhodospirillaceae bacterium]MBT5190709.1 response regulator [Rhodospirillaceae bacterium]MBT5898072.1 response regulator [Rhodospirillaceae bacterium]MBT6430285.1 response regulator [Rhodospirillaceae bacterium]
MAYDLEHLQVQLIEDNRNMRSLVKAMLKALGMSGVRDYADGQQALDALDEFTPDLIITDWMMSPVDGLEFTKYIRTHNDSPDIFTPIILMTGHTEQWRIIAARDTGVNELLAKPITAQTLYARILAVIEKPRPFVRTRGFFGPCRRRVNWKDYMGPERRFVPDQPDDKLDFDLDTADREVAEVERLLESL